MRELHGRMRHYPWGSHTHLAELTGRPKPSAEPEAEIWYGAHPAEPCELGADTNIADGAQSLAEAIAECPADQLGTRAVDQFGAELPFLLKLLAAGEPLSLQAHPSTAQAQSGFARENALGIALDDPKRNYKDPRHKPELLVALTDFEALAGFAELERTRVFFRELEVLKLPAEGLWSLEETVEAWTRLSPSEAAPLVARLGEAAAELAGRQGEFAAHASVIAELAARYPQDPGVLVASLLNHVKLHPGQGLYIPAGALHAHLGGLGVEVMANSDNVLRGGLTAKHVDVDELLSILDFAPGLPAVVEPRRRGHASDEQVFATPAEEFALGFTLIADSEDAHARIAREPDDAQGPRVVLCVRGSAAVTAAGHCLVLKPGDAVWLAEHDPPVRFSALEPETQIFRAWLP